MSSESPIDEPMARSSYIRRRHPDNLVDAAPGLAGRAWPYSPRLARFSRSVAVHGEEFLGLSAPGSQVQDGVLWSSIPRFEFGVIPNARSRDLRAGQ